MKKLLSLLITLSLLTGYMQSEVKWTTTTAKTWVKSTSLGFLISGTTNAICGLDENSGNIVWTFDELGAIQEHSVQEIPNTIFAKIESNHDIYVINLTNGKVILNGKSAGLDKINFSKVLYQSNALIVTGKDTEDKNKALCVDLETASVLWENSEDFGKIIALNEINSEELIVATLFKNARIKTKSGEIIWQLNNSEEADQLDNFGKFGDMMKKASEGMVNSDDLILDFSLNKTKEYFLYGSEIKEEVETSTSSTTATNTTPTYKYYVNYFLYSTETGERVWDKPLKVNGKMGFVLWNDDSFYILPNHENNSKLNKYQTATAEGTLGKKGKGIKIKGGIYNYVETEKGIVIVSSKNNRNFLNFFNKETGLLVIKNPIPVKGSVKKTHITGNGNIAYVTSEEMNIFNPNTGELLLEKDIKTGSNTSVFSGDIMYAFDRKQNAPIKLDLNSLESSVMYTDKIKFQGGEGISKIELRDNGIFLQSSQNVALIDFDGKLIYNQYFAAPKEPGWKQALLIATSVVAAYESAATGLAAAAYSSASHEMGGSSTIEGQITGEIGNAYADYSGAAGSVALQTMQMATARFKATAEADNYVIIMTKEGKEVFLYQVDKNTGTVMNMISIGKDRKPEYSLDLVNEQLFYIDTEGKLRCFQL